MIGLFATWAVTGVLEIRDRDLMRAPRTLDRFVVEFRSCPTFGRAEDNHGPARTLQVFRIAAQPRSALNLANLPELYQRTGERLMHDRRIVALDEMRIVAVAAQQLRQLLAADAGQDPSDWRS